METQQSTAQRQSTSQRERKNRAGLTLSSIQQQLLPNKRRLNSYPLLRNARRLSKLSQLVRSSVVVPFQMMYFLASKGTQQLQRTMNNHPKLTIVIALINSINHHTSIRLHNN